jgi:hypothetical protein
VCGGYLVSLFILCKTLDPNGVEEVNLICCRVYLTKWQNSGHGVVEGPPKELLVTVFILGPTPGVSQSSSTYVD